MEKRIKTTNSYNGSAFIEEDIDFPVSRIKEKRAVRMEHIEHGEDWRKEYNARRNRNRTYNVSIRRENTDNVTVICGYPGSARTMTVLCDGQFLCNATRAIGEMLAKLYADSDNAPRRVLVTLD